jgi:hypothetical protein
MAAFRLDDVQDHATSNAAGECELTSAQLGIWFAHLAGVDKAAYNIANFIELRGSLDILAFHDALARLVDEVESFRIRLTDGPQGPRLILEDRPAWDLPSLDTTDTPDPEATARDWVLADAGRPVDLLHERWFCFVLIRVGPERIFFYQRYHHIIIDGVSVALINVRLGENYNAHIKRSPVAASPFGRVRDVLSEKRAIRVVTAACRRQGLLAPAIVRLVCRGVWGATSRVSRLEFCLSGRLESETQALARSLGQPASRNAHGAYRGGLN